MTFEQAVEKIQALLENADTSKMGEVAFQIEFTNKDCSGIMYIANKNGALDVAGYDYKDNTAAVTLKYGDLTKILTGRLNPVNAVEKGVISAEGDVAALAALSGIAKKAETAETETKTAAKPAAKTAAKSAAKPATAAKAKTGAAKTTSTAKSAAAKTTAAKKTTSTSTAKTKTTKKTTK